MSETGNYTQKWNGSACRQKLDKCCVYVRVHTCAIVCIIVNIMPESMHKCDCECSCEKLCRSVGACPFNTIFTEANAPLFQPQVSAHQSPMALLQGWAWFPFPVTDRDYNWKRMSRSSKQCSEALSECLPGCAVMLNLNAELNKSKFRPLMFNSFSCIGRKRKWNLCLYGSVWAWRDQYVAA